jgi:hypothetical protein
MIPENYMRLMTPNQAKRYLNMINFIAKSGNVSAMRKVINMHNIAKSDVNFNKLTVPKLKKLAINRGIHIHSKMKKSNIIRKLRGN